MPRLNEGEKAPAFYLRDASGAEVSLDSYAGHDTVIYFYPADDTPGCTKQACQFNERVAEFKELGVDVVGISPDGPDSHQRFAKRYGLEITLLSDPDHEVMQAYGAWGEKTLYGRKSIGVIRSTVVVDGAGMVKRAMYNVRADGHAAKLLSMLGS